MAPRSLPPRRRAALVAWRRQAIERMGRSRAATFALLRRLPDEAICRSRTQGAWSIKDVLSHIAAWEDEGTRRLERIAHGRGHRIVWYDTTAEVDRFNRRVVAAARRTGLPRIRRRLTQTRARLVQALNRLPPRALVDPAHDLPITTWLQEFAWTHERAHRREIRTWWQTQRRAQR